MAAFYRQMSVAVYKEYWKTRQADDVITFYFIILPFFQRIFKEKVIY